MRYRGWNNERVYEKLSGNLLFYNLIGKVIGIVEYLWGERRVGVLLFKWLIREGCWGWGEAEFLGGLSVVVKVWKSLMEFNS